MRVSAALVGLAATLLSQQPVIGATLADQARATLLAQCGAATRRYMAVVRDPKSSPNDVGTAELEAKFCWSDLQTEDEIQAEQARRLRPAIDDDMDRPPPNYQPPTVQPYQQLPQPEPQPDMGAMYAPPPETHGCVGQVPVSGPGFNPCP